MDSFPRWLAHSKSKRNQLQLIFRPCVQYNGPIDQGFLLKIGFHFILRSQISSGKLSVLWLTTYLVCVRVLCALPGARQAREHTQHRPQHWSPSLTQVANHNTEIGLAATSLDIILCLPFQELYVDMYIFMQYLKLTIKSCRHLQFMIGRRNWVKSRWISI